MRKIRKILCIILAFFILNSYLATTFADELSDLREEHNQLKEQIEQSNEELTQVQEDLSENLQQVQKLDEKIAGSEQEITKLNEKVENLKVELVNIETQLKEAEEKYEKQKELLEARLIAVYEAGDTQYLDVLLKSRSLSEFLSNYYLVTELASYDMELLEDTEQKKKVVDLAKQKLEKTKNELSTSLQTQTRTLKILQNTKTLRESYVNKLTDQEKEIQANIDEYNRKYAEINSEILTLTGSLEDTEYIGGILAWPVPGYTKITSKYGMRTHPITGVYKLHTGVDISAPLGANFIAANDGVVIKAGYNGAYGNMVIIDHGGGISTLYAHGSEILVKLGQTVTRNQPVLKIGSTGYSTGPHAHFEVRINGVVTDPMEYITNGVIPKTSTNSDENNESTKIENENTENTTN